MKIIITDNYQLMSEIAAGLVIERIKRDKKTVLALPTGGTPIGTYKNLAKAVKNKKISFKLVKTFNLDEYIGLGGTDSHSYHAFMKSKLFDWIDIKKENIFIPDGQAENLKRASADYESLIKKSGGIDLVILGVGLDGHIGFNEPGSAFNSKTRVVKLTIATRRSNARYFNSLKQVPGRAITVGLGTIMKAKEIILLASGERKAGIIKRALKGKVTKLVPASILQKHKNLTIILTTSAAGELRSDKKCRADI